MALIIGTLFVICLAISLGLGYFSAEIATGRHSRSGLINFARRGLSLIFGVFSLTAAARAASLLTEDGRLQSIAALAAVAGILLVSLYMKRQQASQTIAAQ